MNLKKLLITLLKVGISAAIIGYLVYDATQTKDKTANVFTNLVNQPKRWDLLAAGWACCWGAVLLTFIRWWYLVRALDIPLRFRDSIRIGFWGYLFNFLPLGIVGGDVVKTVMLDHDYPRNRAKALASVLVDRVIGLYVLFIVASVAILATQFWQSRTSQHLHDLHGDARHNRGPPWGWPWCWGRRRWSAARFEPWRGSPVSARRWKA